MELPIRDEEDATHFICQNDYQCIFFNQATVTNLTVTAE